jgi:hypothetical protein
MVGESGVGDFLISDYKVSRSGKVWRPFFYPRLSYRTQFVPQVAIVADGGTGSRIQKSSTLPCIFISPRTPVASPPRPPQNGNADSEEVELSLLGEAERLAWQSVPVSFPE